MWFYLEYLNLGLLKGIPGFSLQGILYQTEQSFRR